MALLRALIVDDSETDTLLLLRQLRKEGFSPVHKRVDTAEKMEEALAEQEWDVILCDHIMPSFSGPSALKLLRQKDLDIPFIVVSGQIGEDAAVEAMRAGAHDYIMKGNLKRLGPAIKRELTEAAIRHQRKQIEEELKAKEEELNLQKKIDMVKDEFIGMVSHELKTPLTVIIGALNVATSDGISQEQVKDLINDAATNADTLATMLDNLLELSRYQSDRLNLQKKHTRIEPVVLGVAQKLQARSGSHRIITDIPPGLPAAMSDSIRIERVIYNLIENAIKYSPNGGEVRVSCQEKNGQLVIGVSDQGIGIPYEEQSRLFQSFQRLEIQKKYNIAGIGLGLRVCYILIEAHGGLIWVESAEGKGSTFFFTLPVAD